MSNVMAWTLLIASGLLDVAWAVSLKLADGYSRPGWTAASIALLAAFVFLLGRALAVLPVGTAYVVWTGIGAAGSVLAGAVLFHEPLGGFRLCCIGVVAAGIAGLRLSA